MMRGLTQRRLEDEVLDGLAPTDPLAQASRRDLRRINALMFQSSITASLVTAYALHPIGHIADLGCGDGTGALRTLQKLGRPRPAGTLTLVDMNPSVSAATLEAIRALGWRAEVVTADVFDWLGHSRGQIDLTMSNLFLHHFDTAALAALLKGLASRSATLIATEPARRIFPYLASRSVGAIGANSVTRHDAPTSVRAGFRDRELSDLWPGQVAFEGRRGLFTHAFVGRSCAP